MIEHSFVTTLEAPETMKAAQDFLARRGFVGEGAGFAVGQGQWDRLEMRRGKKPRKARSVSELPQRVHMEWDRGRVTVALAIEPSPAWGGSSWNIQITSGSGVTGTPKKMRLHAELLTAIASGLEALLAEKAAPEVADAQWQLAELKIEDTARRRRRRQWIIGGSVIFLFVALITIIVIAANR